MSDEDSMTTADVRRIVMDQATRYGWPREIRVQWEAMFDAWLWNHVQKAVRHTRAESEREERGGYDWNGISE